MVMALSDGPFPRGTRPLSAEKVIDKPRDDARWLHYLSVANFIRFYQY